MMSRSAVYIGHYYSWTDYNGGNTGAATVLQCHWTVAARLDYNNHWLKLRALDKRSMAFG